MLVRAQHMTIEGNQLDGSRGGVMGLNFTYSMGESARLRNVRIIQNTITGFQNTGIIVANAYRDQQGIPDARDFSITGNVFPAGPAKAIRIRGVQNLRVEGNRFGAGDADAGRRIDISDSVNVQVNHE